MPSSHYISTSRPLAPDLPHLVLEELLGKQPYRDMWGQFVQRRRSTGINIRAVAAFMAYELSDAAGHEISPTKFKDSIRRALKGDALTDRMVMRLISAFGFTEKESDQLWSSVIRYRSTEKSAGAPTTTTKNRGVPEREYEVLSEVLTLEVDKDGLIRQLEVTETLISQQDGLQYLMPFLKVLTWILRFLAAVSWYLFWIRLMVFLKMTSTISITSKLKRPIPCTRARSICTG